MTSHTLEQFLAKPAESRPIILEGRWLEEGTAECWAAADPASVFEGSGEMLADLPRWISTHCKQYPDGIAVGFFAYELARYFENVSLGAGRSVPDISFAFYPQALRLPSRSLTPLVPHSERKFDSNADFEAYRRSVERIRNYIQAGDIYQANLTIPFVADLNATKMESIYLRMRSSESPFRAFIKTPHRTILSNSPERFFRVTGRNILASPIKGTIARSKGDDREAHTALLASEKDRAENLMIVDLLRNDLGRVCDYSTIDARLWDTEELPHLIHLVSHVEGTLHSDVGILEILKALFPCGSITGAPKIRAMQILAELERVPRGVSMGSIGIIRSAGGSRRCTMDFNVAIRTMTIEEGTALFNVGGGIVYDSNATAEYNEVLLKAQPLFDALGPASDVRSRPAIFSSPPKK